MVEQKKLELLELLKGKDAMQVGELAQLLDVSKMTVRRYLTELDKTGQVRRVYGGAMRVSPAEWNQTLSVNPDLVAAQLTIAQMARQFINDGEVVIFGTGNIVTNLAKIVDKRITAITLCMNTANYLLKKENTVYLCGGQVDEKYLNMSGRYAEQMLNSIHADKAFITIGGITEQGELTDPSESLARIQNIILKRASQVYLLLESNKIGFAKLHHAGYLHDIHGLITEQEPGVYWRDLFREANIEVIAQKAQKGGEMGSIQE